MIRLRTSICVKKKFYIYISIFFPSLSKCGHFQMNILYLSWTNLCLTWLCRKGNNVFHSCFTHFWGIMMKSERKTYIIDNAIVYGPIRQLCIHGDLIHSFWQTNHLMTTLSDITNKACNYSRLSAIERRKCSVWLTLPRKAESGLVFFPAQ